MPDPASDDGYVEPEIEVLPLDAWHRARGARMVAFAGYHMPIQYAGIMPEHGWTRTNAGLFDVSHMGQVLVQGPGAIAALEALLPGDLAAMKPDRPKYSLLLSPEGGILDDLMVTRIEDAAAFDADAHAAEGDETLYVVVNGATKYDDLATLREELPDSVTLRLLDEAALLALQGPRAVEALGALIPGVAELGFMQAGAFDLDGTRLWISRSGYTGEDGFEISVPAPRAAWLADRLCAHEAVKPIGLGARDSLRLEAGLPLYGHDLDESVDPVEADLAFAINKRRRAEGGFAGADRILRHLAEGAPRKRVGFLVEGRQPVREGAPILAGERAVGRVTSGGHSPTLGVPIAMGYVAADALDGPLVAPLFAEVRGKRLPLTLTPLPFVPHRYVRKGA